ncbi:MAG: MIP/aquaporin family protein [Bacteroidota bacterium]
MSPFVAEILGTALLLLLGDGVVANVVLKQTKGHGGGWLLINTGWALSVFVGVLATAAVSGAHLNPAVTLGLALAGKFAWGGVPMYLLAQMIGAMLGSALVWLQYRDHFDVTDDPGAKLAVFATGPEIRNTGSNLISEILGTIVLVLAVLLMAAPDVGLGALDALPVALVVFVIGMSLGGTTGYAINPARDLGPRIMHAILPIKGKGDSDWGYAWIPVVGPLIGGALAAGLYLVLS